MAASKRLAAIAIALRKAGKFTRRVATPRKTGQAFTRVQRVAERRTAKRLDQLALRHEGDYPYLMGERRAGRMTPQEVAERLSNTRMVQRQEADRIGRLAVEASARVERGRGLLGKVRRSVARGAGTVAAATAGYAGYRARRKKKG